MKDAETLESSWQAWLAEMEQESNLRSRSASCVPCATLSLLLLLQETKEHLAEYQAHLAGLAKRAKTIIQLKPRNPAAPLKGRLPLQAVCDYKQVEVREEESPCCWLLGQAGRELGS